MSESASSKALRTDPGSFAVRAVSMLFQLVIPLGFGAAAIADDGDLGDVLPYLVPFALAMVGLSVLIAYLQWTRLTYTVGAEDIRVESGVLSRAARSVPFDRIQDVSLEQKWLPRLFGLVEVKFETGAGGGDDLKLTYLSQDEGARLRQTVRSRRDGPTTSADEPDRPVVEAEAELLFTMPPRRVLTFGIFEFSLAVFAVLGGLAQTFESALPWELWDLGGWQDRLAGPEQYLAGLGLLAQVVGIIIAVLSLAVVGVATGLVRTVLREWDFRLERTDKGLRRRRGLLTRTDLVMPVHRVQALRIRTGFIRRRFGWHSLKVVSLASDSGSANHDAAPFARMDEIAPIVRETGFALPTENLDWHRPSARAHLDGALIDFAILTTIAIAIVIFSPFWWSALFPFAFGIFAALREAYLWRFNRHALDAAQLYSRHGWLAPSLAIGSRVKLQSVDIAQGPIARWRGYADLRFGLAGGSLRMRGLPVERAWAVRTAVLESMARRDFSETMEKGTAPD
jgi:putative membrane protein